MQLFTQAIDLFHKGGPVMYLLAACSLFVVAIAVERFLYYRTSSADSAAFQQKLQPLLEKQRFSDAIITCRYCKSGSRWALGPPAWQPA